MKIYFAENPTVEDSLFLAELSEELREAHLEVQEQTVTVKGAKGDLVITLQLITALMVTINTAITVVKFVLDGKPKYSMVLKIGNKTFSAENIPKEQYEEELKKAELNADEIEIKIEKKK